MNNRIELSEIIARMGGSDKECGFATGTCCVVATEIQVRYSADQINGMDDAEFFLEVERTIEAQRKQKLAAFRDAAERIK